MLKGHGNWVTAIATTDQTADMILSSSRDKTVIQWNITRGEGEGGNSDYGNAHRALRGYGIVISASFNCSILLWRFFVPVFILIILDTTTTLKMLSSPRMVTSLSLLLGVCFVLIFLVSSSAEIFFLQLFPFICISIYLLLDATIRLWDLDKSKTNRRFVGHTKDILSVAFSSDNRFATLFAF